VQRAMPAIGADQRRDSGTSRRRQTGAVSHAKLRLQGKLREEPVVALAKLVAIGQVTEGRLQQQDPTGGPKREVGLRVSPSRLLSGRGAWTDEQG
jgi:hypothetical protein